MTDLFQDEAKEFDDIDVAMDLTKGVGSALGRAIHPVTATSNFTYIKQ